MATTVITEEKALVGFFYTPSYEGVSDVVSNRLPGQPLSELLSTLSFKQRITIIGLMLKECWVEIHQYGLIKRDIEPDTILVDVGKDGAIRGLHFIHFEEAVTPKTCSAGVKGSYRYIPPEAASIYKHEEDYSRDIFSLGRIIGELMGVPPLIPMVENNPTWRDWQQSNTNPAYPAFPLPSLFKALNKEEQEIRKALLAIATAATREEKRCTLAEAQAMYKAIQEGSPVKILFPPMTDSYLPPCYLALYKLYDLECLKPFSSTEQLITVCKRLFYWKNENASLNLTDLKDTLLWKEQVVNTLHVLMKKLKPWDSTLKTYIKSKGQELLHCMIADSSVSLAGLQNLYAELIKAVHVLNSDIAKQVMKNMSHGETRRFFGKAGISDIKKAWLETPILDRDKPTSTLIKALQFKSTTPKFPKKNL